MTCFNITNVINEDFNLYIHLLNKYIYGNKRTICELFEYARTICSGLPSYEDLIKLFDTKKNDKGLFGKMIEYAMFSQLPNSNSNSDLIHIGYDIKSCAFKSTRNGKNAKERQTLTNCGNTNNYTSFQNIIDNEYFEDCKYYNKIKKFILFIRDDNKCKHKLFDQILNERLLIIININLETLPNEIKNVLYDDYTMIRNCILNKSVSQKGQKYLHIHTHGQGHGSENRALGFKPKFITMIVGIKLSEMLSIKDITIKKGNSLTINKEYL